MHGRIRSWLVGCVALLAAVVVGSTIAEAVREQSWGPIWAAAWIPAVLIAGLYSRSSRRGCVPRAKRPER